MSWSHRILQICVGILGGLLLVEAGLQAVKIGVQVGDRDRTRLQADEDGAQMRILCLGACYTIGLGTVPAASYPAQLEARLDAELGSMGGDVVVYNGGVRGKSIDYFAREIEPYLTEYQPDIIVLGVNHRTSLDPSPPFESRRIDRLILPRMVALAVSPPPPPPAITLDPIAQEIAALETEVRQSPQQGPLRKKLAQLYAGRGDHEAALDTLKDLTKDRPIPTGLAIKMFRYAAALGRFDEATGYLDVVRADVAFVERMEEVQASRDAAHVAEGRNAVLQGGLDRARIALVHQAWAAAERRLDEVVQRDPETAEAWFMLGYLDHLLDRPARRPATAFLETDRAFLTPETQAFERALEAHLGRMVLASAQHDAAIVLHTLAATDDQIPVIQKVGAAHGVPVIDVQTALRAVDDPDALFHPTDHLRFSEAGNAWLAAQIHQGLEDAGLVPAP